MKRVLLIDMPFGDARCPSLALGMFKTSLERKGIGCDIQYLKLLFAAMVGWEDYVWVTPLTALLAGERTFARTFFGSDIPSDAEYFQYASAYLPPQDIRRLESMARCVGPFLETCMTNIPWDRYDVIGFTSMFEQNVASLALAYEIKRRFPEKVIVFGGANCEDIMGVTLHRCFPFIDYVCSGEADRSFPELIDRIERGQPVSDVPGIVYRANGASVPTGNSERITDMDALPVPDYSEYFRALQMYSSPGWLNPAVLAEASRGCWWGQKVMCTFCGLNGTTIQSRSKSPGRVLDEIELLVNRYNANYVRMVDNMLNPPYFETLLPELERRNSGVRIFFEVRPTLKKDEVKKLAAAGIHDVQAGIENLSTNMLRLMKKGSTSLSGIQMLKWCKQYDIYADWNIIFGFPGEQPADYARNVELVRLLTHLNPPGGVGPFRMDRFSPNYEKASEIGFTDVRPHQVYRFVYPFSDKILSNLVYFFEFRYKEEINDGGYASQLNDEVAAWKSRQDQLTGVPNGEELLVYDSRPVAVESQTHLRGIRKHILEYCDKAHTVDQLQQRLKAEKNEGVAKEEITSVLEEFMHSKLMIKEGSWHLGLPVMPHLG